MGAGLPLQPPPSPSPLSLPQRCPLRERCWPTSRCWPAVLPCAPRVMQPGSQSPRENLQGLGPACVLSLPYWRKLKFTEVPFMTRVAQPLNGSSAVQSSGSLLALARAVGSVHGMVRFL